MRKVFISIICEHFGTVFARSHKQHIISRADSKIKHQYSTACCANNTLEYNNNNNNKIRDEKFFVTTPIFYVNAAPHIGHMQTVVLADAVQRWHFLTGSKIKFSTGTDEHGLKIQQAAALLQLDTSVHCDRVSEKFKKMFQTANISYTDYIRTTEDRHKVAVQHFWELLYNKGYIYKGTYRGWYCTSDEVFVPESLTCAVTGHDGGSETISVESGQPVEWTTEENYMFRLSDFTARLIEWLDNKVIVPQKFEEIVRNWITEGLPDLSVSRQRSRLQWGIPVPGDPTQTIYVWLDALVNYLTIAGYPSMSDHWPADCHVIGKDILKFHAIYWPAFLMAADLDLPNKIFCHSHWTVDNVKMSKSKGNIIDPMVEMDRVTSDGLRYFLLKESVPHSDGNYTELKVVECINSDLVNTLGNLLQRCTSPALNPDQIFPALIDQSLREYFTQEDIDMFNHLCDLVDTVDQHYRHFYIYRGLDEIMAQLRWANALVQHHKPWELIKDTSQKQHLDNLLNIVMETLVVCGTLLQPVIPQISDKLLTRLGMAGERRSLERVPGQNRYAVERQKNLPRKLGKLDGVLLNRIKANNK